MNDRFAVVPMGARSLSRRSFCATLCLITGGLFVKTEAAAAPFVGPSRAQVLEVLRVRRVERSLPIVLGRHEPQALIRREGENWVLRALEPDEAPTP